MSAESVADCLNPHLALHKIGNYLIDQAVENPVFSNPDTRFFATLLAAEYTDGSRAETLLWQQLSENGLTIWPGLIATFAESQIARDPVNGPRKAVEAIKLGGGTARTNEYLFFESVLVEVIEKSTDKSLQTQIAQEVITSLMRSIEKAGGKNIGSYPCAAELLARAGMATNDTNIVYKATKVVMNTGGGLWNMSYIRLLADALRKEQSQTTLSPEMRTALVDGLVMPQQQSLATPHLLIREQVEDILTREELVSLLLAVKGVDRPIKFDGSSYGKPEDYAINVSKGSQGEWQIKAFEKFNDLISKYGLWADGSEQWRFRLAVKQARRDSQLSKKTRYVSDTKTEAVTDPKVEPMHPDSEGLEPADYVSFMTRRLSNDPILGDVMRLDQVMTEDGIFLDENDVPGKQLKEDIGYSFYSLLDYIKDSKVIHAYPGLVGALYELRDTLPVSFTRVDLGLALYISGDASALADVAECLTQSDKLFASGDKDAFQTITTRHLHKYQSALEAISSSPKA